MSIDLALRHALLTSIADLAEGAHIAVGCSGGADSVALVRAAVHVGRERNMRVSAVVIDHQLQKDSSSVAAHAVTLCHELGADPVMLIPVHVDVTDGGLEAGARNARRAAFEQYSDQNHVDAVLLGHTRDDQAETVLLGLARGSGARSLSGIRPVDGLYRRPFLDLSREQVRMTVSDLETIDDPHNLDERFSRVRVRQNVLPVLESELGPGIARALARTADLLRDDADYLDSVADHLYAEVGTDVDALSALAPAIRTRILRRQAIAAGALANDLSRDHVMAIDSLITNWHGQGPLNMPGGVNVERASGRLNFYKP